MVLGCRPLHTSLDAPSMGEKPVCLEATSRTQCSAFMLCISLPCDDQGLNKTLTKTFAGLASLRRGYNGKDGLHACSRRILSTLSCFGTHFTYPWSYWEGRFYVVLCVRVHAGNASGEYSCTHKEPESPGEDKRKAAILAGLKVRAEH